MHDSATKSTASSNHDFGMCRGNRLVMRGFAIAVSLAGCTTAYGDWERFDNPQHDAPGHFHWPPSGSSNWLNFFVGADGQPGVAGNPTTLRHRINRTLGFGSIDGSQSGIQVEALSGLLHGLDSNEMIPSGADWISNGTIFSNESGTDLPEGVVQYIGFRFNLGTGFQYGWVEGIRTGFEFDATAWGYETEIGVAVPAGAPEPGSLVMLAFGGIALLARRRNA